MILSRKTRDALGFFAFAAPWIIGFLFLTLIPMIASAYISFTSWDILTPPRWIGFDNYRLIFSDPLFIQSIRVTLTFTLIGVPLFIATALVLSMLLNNKLPGMRIFRTVIYLPAIISGVVVAVVWQWMLNPDFGMVNAFLGIFGIEGPRWIFSEDWALPSIFLLTLWGVGGNMVIYLAALQNVPTEQYEAARVDGAGWWARFWYITVPGISTVLLFTVLTGIIAALQVFTPALVMTGGGPNNATLFFAFHMYRNAFTFQRMGLACAMAWVLFAIIFVISAIIIRGSRDMVHYASDDGGSI